MTSVIDHVTELVNQLPDDTSIKDVQYHLYVLVKIRKGCDDVSNFCHYTTEKTKEYLR